MSERQGKFIVIEGTDGSGKTEQFNRLVVRLPREMRVKTLDFPQYGKPSAYFVEKYLRGGYGSIGDVNSKAASVFFAVDRFDVKMPVEQWLEEGATVVSNRYVASNMGHQGAKIEDEKERAELFKWLYELEFGEIFGLPRPDLNVILHVPAEIAYDLVERKEKRNYLAGARRDIHEASLEHLRNAERAYLEIARLFPQDFTVVECAEGGKLFSIDEVHEKVWLVVSKLLGIG